MTTSQWTLDKAYERRGGHLQPFEAKRLTVGSTCHARPGAGFAVDGQVCTVTGVLSGGRVRIWYGDVAALIVDESTLL